MSNEHNEPAFPSERAFWSQGMTLRDYFAAKAMQAILSQVISAGGANKPEDAAPLSGAAYFMADAMLKARQQ